MKEKKSKRERDGQEVQEIHRLVVRMLRLHENLKKIKEKYVKKGLEAKIKKIRVTTDLGQEYYALRDMKKLICGYLERF